MFNLGDKHSNFIYLKFCVSDMVDNYLLRCN